MMLTYFLENLKGQVSQSVSIGVVQKVLPGDVQWMGSSKQYLFLNALYSKTKVENFSN